MTKEDWQVRNVLSVELVAAYVRVSSQEQKLHGLSLDAQRMKLTEYAEAHNMKIVEWYVDEGVSGRKLIKNRPELQRMIQDAEKRKFDRIIFIKLDRFFRSVAEYHECMKRISPVVWTTTEEKYDLTSASGRFFVNAKLAVAEMEADQTGERIRIVNEYKVSTGQPLVGDKSLPFGFTVETDATTGKKRVVIDKEEESIARDLLEHYMLYQSKRKTLVYAHTKHHLSLSYSTVTHFLTNTMLYGEYRGNPSYCEAYIDKDTFDKLQDIIKRNIKDNTTENRAYLFSGLLICPSCGNRLKGSRTALRKTKTGEYKGGYKVYRCAKQQKTANCPFNKMLYESTVEKLMLANIEKYLEDAKLRSAQVANSEAMKNPQHNIDNIHEQIDRLNYSWQTGKIRKVEQYEKEYAELLEKLEAAEAERGEVDVKDFGKIEAILQVGWKEIYNKLDDAHKRAFWRSFVQSIEIRWTTERKEIVRVNFF